MERLLKHVALATLVCLVAGAAFAQTTGRIEGSVASLDGSKLPGVVVSATSPSLQGERSTVTGEQGTFRFPNLPPGTYTVRATLEGFNTLEQQEVAVSIDRTSSLVMQMSSSIEEEITVTSESPVVDITSTTTGVNVTRELFEQLPLGRDFYQVAQIAAGTGEDREGTTISGATSVENQYVIEGLNTTGVELGQQNKALNFDFIEEVQVITGGLQAEHGRVSGGIINAITKSGGNDFEGSVFGYYESDDTKSNNETAAELRDDAFQIVETTEQSDLGFSLGGRIIRDKLWFFAALDQVDETESKTLVRDIPVPGGQSAGTVIDSDIERDLFAGKLTWNIQQSHSVAVSAFGDPTTKDGSTLLSYQQITGPPSTYLGTRDTGGTDFIGRYDGVFGSSWVVEAAFGRHQEEDKIDGPGKSIPHIIDQTQSGSPTSGGFGFHQDQEFDRDIYKISVSKFLGDNHELKLGGDVEDLSAENANWNGGAGTRIYIRPRFGPNGEQEYRHRFYVDNQAAGFDANNPATWQLAVPLVSTPETQNTAYFLQDSWRVAGNVTLNLGVRFEQQEIGDRFGDTQIDLDDNWAGRLGGVWDMRGDGRSKLFGNYGRYFMSIPMDINIRAFGGEVQCFCYNFSTDPNNFQPDPNAPENSSLLGAGGTPVDPDLGGQYVDEFLIGYEYEVFQNFAVGIQGTYRDLGSVVEDFLIVSQGNYFISNPGSGLGTEVTFYDYYFNTYPDGSAVTNFNAPVQSPDREYTSLQLTARKRFSNNWQLLASYTWTELEGNYDGAFQVSTGQLDPTINSAFDYADFLVNASGPLSLEQQHQFRVDGSYRFDNELGIGASVWYRSGYPQNAYGYSSAYNNHELYLVPRGSLGEGPDQYEMDVHVGYPLQLGKLELNLMLDVFNLLDRQEPTRLDERFNRPEDGFCPSNGVPVALCSNMGGIRNASGTLNASGSLGNARALSPNPNFLTNAFRSTDFTGQRTFRLGVRLAF